MSRDTGAGCNPGVSRRSASMRARRLAASLVAVVACAYGTVGCSEPSGVNVRAPTPGVLLMREPRRREAISRVVTTQVPVLQMSERTDLDPAWSEAFLFDHTDGNVRFVAVVPLPSDAPTTVESDQLRLVLVALACVSGDSVRRRHPELAESVIEGVDRSARGLTWEEARTYCASAGMRLMTDVEWDEFARVSPTTGTADRRLASTLGAAGDESSEWLESAPFHQVDFAFEGAVRDLRRRCIGHRGRAAEGAIGSAPPDVRSALISFRPVCDVLVPSDLLGQAE